MNPVKIFVINFGSTSTKIAYFEDETCVLRESINHPVEEIKACATVNDQYGLRKAAILAFMNEHGLKLQEMDSITTRGGQTEPIKGGTYRINEAMVEQVCSGEYGHHVCGVGVLVAYDLCKESGHAVPLTTDTPTTDEMDAVARYSGLKEISRVSCVQALNTKAMAKYYAEQNGKAFEDVRVITVMLGGGIGVCAIRDGRMVDAPDGLEVEGPFSNNRCCTVPVGQLVKLCYSGKYDLDGMIRHINGEAGLMAYLGTTDIRAIMKRIEDGDTYAGEVMEAMCYQTAKEIGAMAAVLEGRVDAVILIGGMANVPFITEHIKRRVSFIAPVVIMPGEREMEALAEGSLQALRGEIPMQTFAPSNQA